MLVRCQCGAVSFETPTAQPLSLYHCHCLECRKQSASAFGTSAIFPASPLFPLPADLSSKLAVYTRPTENPTSKEMDCYFCKKCGVRMMHRIKNKDGSGRDTISIKGGVVEGLDWKGGKHIYTRTAVVPIPEGVEAYETVPGGGPDTGK